MTADGSEAIARSALLLQHWKPARSARVSFGEDNMLRTTALAVLCCLSIAAAHAQQTSPTTPASEDAQLSIILDPARPTAERLREFSALMQEANAGDANAQNIAGSWYWRGHDQTGVVVEQDLTQARALLSHAAIQGQFGAMAKMAELELQAGRTFEAMLWAQVYGHYQPLERKDAHESVEDEDYTGFLLRRIYAKFDSKQMAEVGTAFNAFLAKYDATIRAGIEHSNKLTEHGNLHELSLKNLHLPSTQTLAEPDVAEFFIAYGPDGQPVQVLPIVAYPDSSHRLVAILTPIAQQIRMNSVIGSRLRYAVIPIVYNTGMYSVKKP